MLIVQGRARVFTIPHCHGGSGSLLCREYLGDYQRPGAGLTFVHDDLLDPGSSIGLHRHAGDEEVYVILEGNGHMEIDGNKVPVHAGDACITRDGERHSLRNSGDGPMRILVVGANLRRKPGRSG